MKKQTEICKKCEKCKVNQLLYNCDLYDFDMQIKIDKINIFAEEIEPPKECIYILDHLVLSQDMSSLS